LFISNIKGTLKHVIPDKGEVTRAHERSGVFQLSAIAMTINIKYLRLCRMVTLDNECTACPNL